MKIRLCLLSCVLCLTGCAGYRLGTTLPPGIKHVYVATFVNETGEPQLEVETTRAAIREFQQDGTLRTASLADADAKLEVTLREFRLDPLRYERDQDRLTSEYRLMIRAVITFTRLSDNHVMLVETVEGEEDFVPLGDVSLAKREALPEAADDLAHEIVKRVVEYW